MYTHANARYRMLAQELIDVDPFVLGHVDVSTVVFLYKEEKNPKWPMRILGIREPFIMLTNKSYIVEISEELAENLSQEHRELHMYKVLRQIDKESGRIIHPDVIEFSDIIDLFGYDWQSKMLLPSIIDQLEAKTIANTLVKDTEVDEDVAS